MYTYVGNRNKRVSAPALDPSADIGMEAQYRQSAFAIEQVTQLDTSDMPVVLCHCQTPFSELPICHHVGLCLDHKQQQEVRIGHRQRDAKTCHILRAGSLPRKFAAYSCNATTYFLIQQAAGRVSDANQSRLDF